MVFHVVLFTPRADLSAADRERLLASFTRALSAIPSVKRTHVGRRVTHGRPYERLMSTDYEYAAIIEFDDLAGLQAYLEHPAHEELATRFFAAFETALMYDYEMTEGEAGRPPGPP